MILELALSLNMMIGAAAAATVADAAVPPAVAVAVAVLKVRRAAAAEFVLPQKPRAALSAAVQAVRPEPVRRLPRLAGVAQGIVCPSSGCAGGG